MIKWKKKADIDGIYEGVGGGFVFRCGIMPGGWWLLVYVESDRSKEVYDKYSLASLDAVKRHSDEFLKKVGG